MDEFVYDAALLDDAALQQQLEDDGNFDDDETFGGGLLEDTAEWEQNQDLQLAEFERIRQEEFGSHVTPAKNRSPPLEPGQGAEFFNQSAVEVGQLQTSASAQSRPRHQNSELHTPAFFQADDDDQSLSINQSLDRLLSEDDGENKGRRNGSQWMAGGGSGAGQWSWSSDMQHVPLRATSSPMSATTDTLANLNLGQRRLVSEEKQHAEPPHGANLSLSNLFATAAVSTPVPPPAKGSVDLAALLSPGSNEASAFPTMPPSRGVRLEDLESNLRGGNAPHTSVVDSQGSAEGGSQSSNAWVQKLQALRPASGSPEIPHSPSRGAAPVPNQPSMLPPRPLGPAPPPGSVPAPRPDTRPSFPPGPPPRGVPPIHPGMQMRPPPWLFPGPPPPPGQRVPDMKMLQRFGLLPPGMPRPPMGDPANWRSHPPVPPNFRPPMMPGMPFPAAGMSRPPPPSRPSSNVGGPGSSTARQSAPAQHQHHHQQQSRAPADYPFVFMTNREKEWILKVQLIQLSRYSSAMDDYYYLSYSRKRQSGRAALALPKLDADVEVKPEGAQGRVTIFEGALGGRISTGSVHCPRQTLMLDGPVNAAHATGASGGQTTLHRRRTYLLAIETAYDAVLKAMDLDFKENIPEDELTARRQHALADVYKRIRVRSLQDRVKDLKSSSPDEYSMSFLSVSKGARLVVRMIPYLPFADVQSLAGLLCHHLLTFLKLDEEKVAVRVLLSGFKGVCQRWSLTVLVCLLEMLISQPVAANKVATVAMLIEYHSAAAVEFLSALIGSGYRLCQSAEHSAVKKQWQQCCLRLHHLLEPHRTGLLRLMSDNNEASYLEFLEVLAHSASGSFATPLASK